MNEKCKRPASSTNLLCTIDLLGSSTAKYLRKSSLEGWGLELSARGWDIDFRSRKVYLLLSANWWNETKLKNYGESFEWFHFQEMVFKTKSSKSFQAMAVRFHWPQVKSWWDALLTSLYQYLLILSVSIAHSNSLTSILVFGICST